MSATGSLLCGQDRCLELWKKTWPELRSRSIDWTIAQRLECDVCAEERARRNRLLSTVTANADPKRQAILNTAPYIHPCNWPKYQASQKRAALFAQAQGSQILWVRAVDVPNTSEDKGMSKARLEELRAEWLQLHDRQTGGVMGLFPATWNLPHPLHAHPRQEEQSGEVRARSSGRMGAPRRG